MAGSLVSDKTHLGFSHISPRPRHPGQNAEIVEAYKKTSRGR
jgi:Winged helix-turn helix